MTESITTKLTRMIEEMRNVHAVEPFGILCSVGVFGRIQTEGIFAPDQAPVMHTDANPDAYVLLVPVWAIRGYPPGQVDVVDQETAEECLRFVGRMA